MTDDVTINVVEGKTGPRLTFSRPVAFVEVPYGSVPELIKELVLEYGRQRTGPHLDRRLDLDRIRLDLRA